MNLLAVGRYEEARARYAAAVALDAAGPHPLIPLFLALDGMFHGDQDQIALAMPSVLDHPDPWVRAVGLGVRGRWRHETGDPDGADRDTKDALDALLASREWTLNDLRDYYGRRADGLHQQMTAMKERGLAHRVQEAERAA